ncbi:hypothetical protein SARC_15645, partial [Sphaeroforma arctica JP610]
MGDADTLSRLAGIDDEADTVVMTLLGDKDEPTTHELLLELNQDLAHVGYKILADFYRKVTKEEVKEQECCR